MLTVGSLFAGIGGFDLGLERAGMRSVWQSEIDPFCQRVLAKHWPDVLRVPDVRDVGAGTVPYVDVICGGFPCQDLSYAGRGAGIGGERSGLWSEYARVVDELRPRYVVVENVSALLARGLDVVLGDLAALRYDAEWDCIPASAVGAPHRRDRIWIVAYPRSEQHEGSGDAQRRASDPDTQGTRLEGAGLQGRPAVLREDMADADDERWDGRPRQLGTSRRPEPTNGGQGVGDADGAPADTHAAPGGSRGAAGEPGRWAAEPDVGRVAHGVPARVDRLRSLGNALVPQIAEWLGRRIIEWELAA